MTRRYPRAAPKRVDPVEVLFGLTPVQNTPTPNPAVVAPTIAPALSQTEIAPTGTPAEVPATPAPVLTAEGADPRVVQDTLATMTDAVPEPVLAQSEPGALTDAEQPTGPLSDTELRNPNPHAEQRGLFEKWDKNDWGNMLRGLSKGGGGLFAGLANVTAGREVMAQQKFNNELALANKRKAGSSGNNGKPPGDSAGSLVNDVASQAEADDFLKMLRSDNPPVGERFAIKGDASDTFSVGRLFASLNDMGVPWFENLGKEYGTQKRMLRWINKRVLANVKTLTGPITEKELGFLQGMVPDLTTNAEDWIRYLEQDQMTSVVEASDKIMQGYLAQGFRTDEDGREVSFTQADYNHWRDNTLANYMKQRRAMSGPDGQSNSNQPSTPEQPVQSIEEYYDYGR